MHREKTIFVIVNVNHRTMKIKCLFAGLFLLATGITSHAQYYYRDAKNPEMLRHGERNDPSRKEIILPEVNGYTVYKVDLHTHSVFSDGQVVPKFRVQEAWQDGLDAMAVTEHLESRSFEGMFHEYLKEYTNKEYKPKTEGISGKRRMVDLNFVVNEAKKEAARNGLLIIPGTEISRNGAKVGHFNALFTTDNNTIYDPDAVQSMRNAKAQGALVMHNHPGWRRVNMTMTEVEKAAYDEGLIDGVEVMNSEEFYPMIIDRVRERGLFIAANSDIHVATDNIYGVNGQTRPMTLILARECSLDSLKSAIEARRSIAYCHNTLCGEKQLLEDFFKASVKVRPVPGQENVCMLTNMTSVPYVIDMGKGGNHLRLNPFSTIRVKASKKTGKIKFTLVNVWIGVDSHLKVVLPQEWN